MPYSGGILIIGSLYWDNGVRKKWRTRQLDKEEFRVKAPFRYGRLSTFGRRRDTYTMVFSMACCTPTTLGQAIVVRCSHIAQEYPDLISEAEHLWAAERGAARDGSISSDWGCVGLLGRRIPPGWLAQWAKDVHGKPGYGKLAYAADDHKPAVSAAGLLEFAWPERLDGSPLELDFLLATANEPLPKSPAVRYPDAPTIAAAWNQDCPKSEYFRCNQAHGIYTFQDAAIIQDLKCPEVFNCNSHR